MGKTEVKKPPTLQQVSSHYITLVNHPDGIKEEVYLYFNAHWRGEEVTVKMQASRYTHSAGLSEWRVYCTEAYSLPDGKDHYINRKHVTPTARARLADECETLVVQWLRSQDYRRSESAAYCHAIKEMLRQANRYSDEPTRDARQKVVQYSSKLTPMQREYLLKLADAVDEVVSLYNQKVED